MIDIISKDNAGVMGLPAADETDIMNRIKAGRIDYAISKPFRFGEIQKAVRYFLDTG